MGTVWRWIWFLLKGGFLVAGMIACWFVFLVLSVVGGIGGGHDLGSM